MDTSVPAGTVVATPAAYRWPAAVGLHLLPGLLFLAGCLAFRPVTGALGLPQGMGFTLAGLVLVTPFQLTYLAWRGRGRHDDGRHRGGRRARGLRAAIGDAAGFRRRLPARDLTRLVVGLVAFTAVTLFAMSPVTGFLDSHVFTAVPGWLRSDDSNLHHFPAAVIVGYLLLNLVGDAVLSPIAEELYYRGHLMARLPVQPVLAAAVGAALFASTHFWEPALIPFVFVVQAALGLAVRWTGSIRVSVFTHIAVNVLSTALTIAALA